MNNGLHYKVAVSLLNGVGPITTKKLIAYTGSVEGVFKEKKQLLLKIPGVGTSHIRKLNRTEALNKAAEEIKFIEANKIRCLFYLDTDFPQRLLHCADGPVLLYCKGEVDFNASRIISIVGTRNASDYGRAQCANLIKDLAQKGHFPLIVSGLAYGIDIHAHKAALQHKLETLAVLGHGLDTLYPAHHRKYAGDIVKHGALLSEFTSKCPLDPKNFVRRNRIIAGISDATIVVESAKTGGSLVTANIANSYNRDVFAFPGRSTDQYSAGCNHLIKSNQAHLIESVADLEYILGWDTKVHAQKAAQPQLFKELSPEEEKIRKVLKQEELMPIDIICVKTSLRMSRVSSLLLKMEFEGIVRSYPGKVYSLNA